MSKKVIKCLTEGCANLVYERFIFCRDCFQVAGSAARTRWRIAFPYPEGYADVVFDPGARRAVSEMLEAVKFGKSQLCLFDELSNARKR